MNLSWYPPADNGGAPITGYRIYWGTSSGSYTHSVEVGNVTNYTIIGLENGKTYYFAVAAINSIGEGPKSHEVRVTILLGNSGNFWYILVAILVLILIIGVVMGILLKRRKI